MKQKRRHKKIKRSKHPLKNEWKQFLFVFVICLVVGIAFAFLTGKMPSFLDRTIQKYTDRIAAEQIKGFEKKVLKEVTGDNLDVVKKYKDAKTAIDN